LRAAKKLFTEKTFGSFENVSPIQLLSIC